MALNATTIKAAARAALKTAMATAYSEPEASFDEFAGTVADSVYAAIANAEPQLPGGTPPIQSVFGRTGDVVAQLGDYAAFRGALSITVLSNGLASTLSRGLLDPTAFSAWVENTNWKHTCTPDGGISYDDTTGLITVANAGRYRITSVGYYFGGSGLLVMQIKLNGATEWQAQPYVHGSVDPVERSTNNIFDLAAGTTIEIVTSGVNNARYAGTTVSVERIG
jgi:hypothetical protein